MQSRTRIGDQKCVHYIITLMKSTDPDDVPAFVVNELHKLGSARTITFEHVDVTKLLKDVTTPEASLADKHAKLEVSNNTIEELHVVVLFLNTVLVSSSLSTSNI